MGRASRSLSELARKSFTVSSPGRGSADKPCCNGSWCDNMRARSASGIIGASIGPRRQQSVKQTISFENLIHNGGRRHHTRGLHSIIILHAGGLPGTRRWAHGKPIRYTERGPMVAQINKICLVHSFFAIGCKSMIKLVQISGRVSVLVGG